MNDSWQACPDGHGILINGRNLARIHSRELSAPSLDGQAAPHGQLTCPNCHNLMINTNYEGSTIKIDSCEHCPFRWLDADDIPLLTPKQA
ncbi:MAG TPA: zf-TFIIB domain-containing protein, partial [Candidatus Saccharimonadales bacterium]